MVGLTEKESVLAFKIAFIIMAILIGLAGWGGA
jgi:hypothetical protein